MFFAALVSESRAQLLDPVPQRTERELPLWAVERTYRRSPNNLNWVHAFIRAQVLARTNLSSPVVARPLPNRTRAEFKFFTEAPNYPDSSPRVTAEKLLADLEFLEVILANVYSYADRRGEDWRGALDALRASVGEGLPIDTFALRLRRFFTLFGDPHTGVHAPHARDTPTGRAAFLTVPDGDRVLVLRGDRSGFLSDQERYLAAIDGLPVSEWLRVAGYDVPRASPQWTRTETVQLLNHIDYLRSGLGLPRTNRVSLTLTSSAGTPLVSVALPVGTNEPAPAARSYGKTRLINGSIAYLRIEQMANQERFLDRLNEIMARFRDSRGLVIDVRGNAGGSQDVVKTLLPYFLDLDAPFKIINVAAYRLPVKLPQPCSEGYLGLYGRGLYPVTSEAWSETERNQIRVFLQKFTPEWKLPPNLFSDWHVMGIRADSNPKAYYYTNAVVVLCDADCFSATDNFLGALKGQPNVTLLGTASGGGSGRMTEYRLPNTHLPLTVCQMASFRANGDLFDGRGVTPDVVVEPKPTDFIIGGGDSVLEAALSRLKPAK